MTTHNRKTSHRPHNATASGKPASERQSSGHVASAVPAVAAPTLGFNTQTLLIFALVVAAFFGAYRFARANNSTASAASVTNTGAAASGLGTASGATGSGGAAAGGGGCCGGGGAGGGAAIQGAAKVAGGIQKISVDASQGYNPNVITLKAGVPAEITFSQSSGCTAIVQSQQLGFQEDLSAGAKTVKLGALPAGTYGFSCGMGMVTGQIIVK